MKFILVILTVWVSYIMEPYQPEFKFHGSEVGYTIGWGEMKADDWMRGIKWSKTWRW